MIRPLGAGAFKEAYLIEREGAEFALKIALVTGELRSRFEREITALRECEHSAIAKIIASTPVVYSGAEYWVIVEEYLPCGTLAELVANGSISVDAIRSIGITLAGALEHLSARSFVHRDIKPANILFRTPIEPVLTDFGIVRILDEKSLTQDFMLQGPGTPRYAAPEQLLNEKSAIDWRTDQFGLALVLSELVLGHHAFSTSSVEQPREAVIAVAKRESLPEVTKNRLSSSGFSCLVKALSPWPVQRYRRPADFILALSQGN